MPDLEMEQLAVEVSEYMRTRYFGKYRGLVKEVGKDKDKLGQIKALVPEVYGEKESDSSPWARPCVPFAGKNHGFIMLPEEGDGVWIEFEAGDPSRPIWTGCWWAEREMPDHIKTTTKELVTSKGHRIVLDDGEENKLQLLHSGGAELTMTNDEIALKIGQTQIVLSSFGVNINNGAFEVR